MVADDQTAGSQTEDPLPRGGHVAWSAAGDASPLQASVAAVETVPNTSPTDASTSRVPLWDRLPRSIWLMSVFALCQ